MMLAIAYMRKLYTISKYIGVDLLKDDAMLTLQSPSKHGELVYPIMCQEKIQKIKQPFFASI